MGDSGRTRADCKERFDNSPNFNANPVRHLRPDENGIVTLNDRDTLAREYSLKLLDAFGSEIVKSSVQAPLQQWEPAVAKASYRLADLMIAESQKTLTKADPA